MPMLDVSAVLSDPMFEDEFLLRRRLDVIRANGRTEAALDRAQQQFGVITMQNPTDLMRLEDGQTIPRRILVISTVRLIGAAPGQQPDEITWNGGIFTVAEAMPWSKYGEGFYEAVCEFREPIPPVQ